MDKTTRDKAIQTALASGDPVAVEWLWEDYSEDLFAFLCGFLGRRPEAEDCLQQVFITLVQKRDRLAQARSLKAYLFQMARNEARTLLKRVSSRTPASLQTDWLVTGSSEVGLDLRDQMVWALNQLPEKQRTVLVFKLYREHTFLEISDMLGLSPNTVASQYRYGLARLRTLLGDKIHES
ncbi:MAG: sigma-70 family RNA polymerase sigma factor [Phycisphaerae bacterium]|nr:sigma-70 family RNA polymerase sigma factor [Phycisphaerae bacterium]